MFGAWVKLGVSGATPNLGASPRGAHLVTATPAATGLAAVHALESRRRLTRPKRKPTAERPGGGRRVGHLMAPSIAIDIHPEGTAARVDVVNTFRCIRRSFHVVSRRFALSNSVFPQVTGHFAPSSIPGSSTEMRVDAIPGNPGTLGRWGSVGGCAAAAIVAWQQGNKWSWLHLDLGSMGAQCNRPALRALNRSS